MRARISNGVGIWVLVLTVILLAILPSTAMAAEPWNRALLVQDNGPWGTSSNEDVLTALGIPYDMIASSEVTTTDLSQYRGVVFAGDQSLGYWQALDECLPAIEAFVANGGILVAHVCDYDDSPNWSGLTFLPGGVTKANAYLSDLSVVAIDHPVVAGAPSTNPTYFDGFDSSTHGYFTTLPEGGTAVIACEFGPTYIDYPFGAGRVLATMQPIEVFTGWWERPEFMDNEFRFAFVDSAPPTTTIDGIPSGLTDDAVTFALIAEDSVGGSGVDAIYYTLDGSPAVAYDGPVTVSKLGTTTVEFWAEDVAGNVEDTQTAIFEIGMESSAAVEGEDRYQTAIDISQANWEAADAVVIATGQNWPDALGGSALAGAVGGPVLLSRQGEVPEAVLAEVERLGATQAYVLGGEQALTPDVLTQLEGMLGVDNVARIGGVDRYETAELIADEVVSLLGDSYDGTAFLATGEQFADALAAAPMAAANGWPVYLAPQPVITAATLDAMLAAGVTDAILLGGDAAMPEDTAVTVLASGIGAVRIDGEDRYETAAKVAEYGVTTGGLVWDGVAIATGENFPDALAGGPAQGLAGSGLLLSPGDLISSFTSDKLTEHKYEISYATFLGGTESLSDAVRDAVMMALD